MTAPASAMELVDLDEPEEQADCDKQHRGGNPCLYLDGRGGYERFRTAQGKVKFYHDDRLLAK
jgi:hypothetical protein